MARPKRGYNKEVRFYIDAQTLSKLDGLAAKHSMNRSEMTRQIIAKAVADEGAIDGIDTVVPLLRRVVQNELRPQIDRLAKMIAKDTKASAAGMFMQVVDFHKQGEDHRLIYNEAMKKAAAYLNSKEEN